MFKTTKNPKIEEMTKSHTDRALQLSCYPVIALPDGRRMCLWCDEKELPKRNMKYCSAECSEAIYAWAQPQKENGLHVLMVRQEWKCNACQFDYTEILNRVLGYFNKKNYLVPNFGKDSSRHFMKIFKNNCPKERAPEVDHIIPIYKGGTSLGFSNHQGICFTCHKTKTKMDLSGKRIKKP